MKYALGRGITQFECLTYPDEEFVFYTDAGDWKPRITNASLFDTVEDATETKVRLEATLETCGCFDDCPTDDPLEGVSNCEDCECDPVPPIRVIKVVPDWN